MSRLGTGFPGRTGFGDVFGARALSPHKDRGHSVRKSRAIVLGSGTSNGVPMLGVRYPESFLANPKNHRTRCSLLLEGPEGNVLVDCAPEMRLQLLRAGVFELVSVIITHTHADHIMGMDDLRSFCIMQAKNMPVYTLKQYQEDIKRVFAYAFGEFPQGIEVPRFDLRDVPFQSWESDGLPPALKLGGLSIQPFIVKHGPLPVIALRVNNFAYVTDVSEIPKLAMKQFEGLDTLILDAVRIKPHPNHFNLEEAVKVAQRIGAKQTYFTHLSHDYDHDVTNQELPDRIELAYDGLTINI